MGKISGAGELVLEDLRTLYTLGNAGGRTDGQLVSVFLAGDTQASEEAFGVLVGRHGPMVMGVCSRILMDRHAAEDAFQATFLVLARRARSIRRSESIGGWLHRVARRIAVRAGKRATRGRPSQQDVLIHAESLVAEGPSPVEAVDRSELRTLLDGEIDRLDPTQRQVVVLCDLEELTYEQAAERLHWPVGTVKSRLSRGRIRLRERLTRRGLAPALVAGTGAVCGGDALASLSAPLVQQVIRTAMLSLSGSPTVPVAVSALAVDELKSSAASRLLRWTVAALLMGGGSVAAVVVASSDRPDDAPKLPTPFQVAPAKASKPDEVPKLKLSARGQVLDGDAHPVSNARVYMREWASRRTNRADETQRKEMERTGMLPDILAQVETDAEGRFQFEHVNASGFPGSEENRVLGKSWFPWDLIILAKGYGIAWRRMTSLNHREPTQIRLYKEATLEGHVLGIDGKPIEGASVRVVDMADLNAHVNDLQMSESRLVLHWSSVPFYPEARSDREGRFVVHNLHPDRRITLVVSCDGFQRNLLYAATTRTSQPDLNGLIIINSREVRSRHPIQTGELSVTLKKNDHRLSGRLVFEGSDRPVVGVVVSNGMMSSTKTDRNGHFQFDHLAAGSIKIHAIASDKGWAPLDLEVEIPESPKAVERQFQLPRGISVSGRVVADDQTAIADVVLFYECTQDGVGLPTQFFLETTTDAKGRFQLQVPEGPGKISVYKVPLGFMRPNGRFLGSGPEDGMSRFITGKSGASLKDLEFTLEPSPRASIQVVAESDKPVQGVVARRYTRGLHEASPPTTDMQGRVELVGLTAVGGEATHTFDLVHPGRQIGARLELSAKEVREGRGEMKVNLTPLGVLEGHVMDGEGKPLLDAVVTLYTNVKNPHQEQISLDRQNGVKSNGFFRFEGLVPGGSYFVEAEVEGRQSQVSRWFIAKPKGVEILETFRMPITDKDLRGVVLDSRGRPFENVVVRYLQRKGDTLNNTIGRWDTVTDALGRFELTGLPRGAITVEAYRRAVGAEPPMHNRIRIEVAGDTDEIQIALPTEH